jgi:hypothetical protein
VNSVDGLSLLTSFTNNGRRLSDGSDPSSGPSMPRERLVHPGRNPHPLGRSAGYAADVADEHNTTAAAAATGDVAPWPSWVECTQTTPREGLMVLTNAICRVLMCVTACTTLHAAHTCRRTVLRAGGGRGHTCGAVVPYETARARVARDGGGDWWWSERWRRDAVSRPGEAEGESAKMPGARVVEAPAGG